MKKIMAVYDEDPFYAERLSDYINRREDGIFSARAFTSRKRLEEFARDHGIDVLLTGTLSEGGFPGLPSVQRILLTEEEVRAGEGGGHGIYKYQSGDDILREVMAAYCETPEGKTDFPGLPASACIPRWEDAEKRHWPWQWASFWPERKSCCSLRWIRLPVFPAFWTSSGSGIFRI